jgi:glycosyltransferase involved in cell wall biosynthesis
VSSPSGVVVVQSYPKISIVTPSYNQASFVGDTIRSVLEQEYPNLEYFVFDACSTDGSIDVIKQFSDKLTYWISEPDKGQSHAINKGWKMSSGEILGWLNSDDMLAPGALLKVAESFSLNRNLGIVYGDWIFIDRNGVRLFDGIGAQTGFRRLLANGQIGYIAQPASFYASGLVRKIGFLDEHLHLAMDYDLLVRLSRIAPIKYINVPLALFRLHGDTKTSTRAKQHWHETLEVSWKYGGIYSWKLRVRYWLFLLMHSLPAPVRARVRNWRKSFRDYVYLEESKR